MKIIKENFISLIIGMVVVISVFISFNITSATNANAKENSVNGISNTTGVRYETIYVGGNRFLIFSNSSGSDIEVFRY
jgi:uncharacterized alpha/beta hydrolase family protein